MERQWFVVRCRNEQCKNMEVLHPDSRVPVEGQWECSACEARRADILGVRRMNEMQNGTWKP